MRIEIVDSVSSEFEESLNRLMPQLTPSARLLTKEDVQTLIDQENVHVFVAKDDKDRIIGTLTLVIFTIPTSKKAFIEDVSVDSEARGQKLGFHLVEAAISFAKEQGVTKIELSSNPSRVAANSLYKKVGFLVRETNFYRLEI